MGGVITAGLKGEDSDEGEDVPLGSDEMHPLSQDDDYVLRDTTSRSVQKENLDPR